MKQESDKRPINKYEIENKENGRCDVVLYDLDSIEEVEHTSQESEETTVSYKYLAYRITINYSESVINALDKNYNALLEIARNEEYERVATEVRKYRNQLLTESDKEMAFDRIGFDIPENITMTNIITVLKSLFKTLADLRDGKWAKYRQELRDISKQEGFPFNVTFPDKPDDTKE